MPLQLDQLLEVTVLKGTKEKDINRIIYIMHRAHNNIKAKASLLKKTLERLNLSIIKKIGLEGNHIRIKLNEQATSETKTIILDALKNDNGYNIKLEKIVDGSVHTRAPINFPYHISQTRHGFYSSGNSTRGDRYKPYTHLRPNEQRQGEKLPRPSPTLTPVQTKPTLQGRPYINLTDPTSLALAFLNAFTFYTLGNFGFYKRTFSTYNDAKIEATYLNAKAFKSGLGGGIFILEDVTNSITIRYVNMQAFVAKRWNYQLFDLQYETNQSSFVTATTSSFVSEQTPADPENDGGKEASPAQLEKPFELVISPCFSPSPYS